MGFLERLKDGLSKTRRNFTDRIEELVGMFITLTYRDMLTHMNRSHCRTHIPYWKNWK